jgi:transposase
VITIGIDPHKRTHTAVAVDGLTGELRGELATPANPDGHRRLLEWARGLGESRRFALEDCRHVSGRLERELIARCEHVVRVPPKLMAGARSAEREFGKSDPIDAAAVARAALRHPDLSTAHLDPAAREIKLQVDHREDLIHERTAIIGRLRWHLHDVAADLEPELRTLDRDQVRRSLARRLARREGTVQVEICRELLSRIGEITRRERKLRAEIAGAERFRSDAQLARHSGCAPLEVSSGKRRRHRLSRRGNRQLNCAFHRIAVTQARVHPEARAYLDRKRAEGKSTREALRCLKRHLTRRVWRLLVDSEIDRSMTTVDPRRGSPAPQTAVAA